MQNILKEKLSEYRKKSPNVKTVVDYVEHSEIPDDTSQTEKIKKPDEPR